MDFTNRSAQSSQATAPNTSTGVQGSPKKKRDRNKWSRVGAVAIVATVAILLIALVASISFSGNANENKYIDTSKLQAVFLNTGQVYFGNVKALNNKYFVLTNIYYLQQTNASGSSASSSSSSTGNNVTLVKLGCELHEPYDQMVINSDQVTFWENLQDNGQVAKAVSTFQKQNPNGLKCTDQSSSSSTNSSSATQNANNGSTSTTPSTSTTGH